MLFRSHPLLLDILARVQSASSLKLLLRSPLGFVWRYGMRLQMPKSGTDPLVLDALAIETIHLTRLDEIAFQLDRSIRQAFTTRRPCAFVLSPLLTGGNTLHLQG